MITCSATISACKNGQQWRKITCSASISAYKKGRHTSEYNRSHLGSFSHMSASNKISMLMVMVAILSCSAVADEGAGSEEGVTDEHALLQMNQARL